MATTKAKEKPATRKRHNYTSKIETGADNLPQVLHLDMDGHQIRFDLGKMDLPTKCRLALKYVESYLKTSHATGGNQAADRAFARVVEGRLDGRSAKANFDLTTRVYAFMKDMDLNEAYDAVRGLSVQDKGELRKTPDYKIAQLRLQAAELEAQKEAA